jgi:hypothetical protein
MWAAPPPPAALIERLFRSVEAGFVPEVAKPGGQRNDKGPAFLSEKPAPSKNRRG